MAWKELLSTAEDSGVGGLGKGSTFSVKFDLGAEGKPDPEITITFAILKIISVL